MKVLFISWCILAIVKTVITTELIKFYYFGQFRLDVIKIISLFLARQLKRLIEFPIVIVINLCDKNSLSKTLCHFAYRRVKLVLSDIYLEI